MTRERPAPLLLARGLSKRYGGARALADASLTLVGGEVRGLVGANGAGKSTLVKVLNGLVRPDRGEISVDGRPLALGRPSAALAAGIASVPQELVVAPGMTVAENVALGHEPRGRLGLLSRRELRRRGEDVLRALGLELPADEPVGTLPLLEQRLVMIARALSRRARLVIFDEPTATVSPREVDVLLRTVGGLAERGVAVLYVSHRLDEIERICDTVTVLRDGRVVAELSERASHAELVGHLAPERAASGPRARAEPLAGEIVLRIAGLGGERLRDVDLDIRAGEIVGLAGVAGSGARELALTVCGAVGHDRGEIRLRGRRLPSGSPVAAVRAGAGFLPGDRSLAAFATHPVRHNTTIAALSRFAHGPFLLARSEREPVAALLEHVGLHADAEAPISSLSGGNQQKAIVARWIASGAALLVLDDPTAGVDVRTRPELHRRVLALRDAGAAILLVSTDVEELAALADRVVTFDRGAVLGELAGDALTPARVLSSMTKGASE